MKKSFIRKSRIKIKYLKLTIIMVIIATFFWFSYFSKHLLPKIQQISAIEAENYTYKVLYNIVNDCVKKVDKTNFLVFKNNQQGELVLSEYNMDEIYNLINLINEKAINNKSYVFFIPGGLVSKNFLFNYWGSKIPIEVKSLNSMYTNIKTKVSDYGLNNALVEVYVVIETKQQLVIPFTKKALNFKYDILVSSYFINGKVPSIYSKNFEISSNIFDISSKI